MTNGAREVRVQATYWIRESGSAASSAVEQPPTRIQCFGSSPNNNGGDTYVTVEEPLRIGLPEGVLPEKRPAGDDSYSGLHDHGPLPPLKEGGPMAVLLACAQQAKKFNDDYLTEVIAAQRKGDEDSNGTVSNPVKKAKVDS